MLLLSGNGRFIDRSRGLESVALYGITINGDRAIIRGLTGSLRKVTVSSRLSYIVNEQFAFLAFVLS